MPVHNIEAVWNWSGCSRWVLGQQFTMVLYDAGVDTYSIIITLHGIGMTIHNIVMTIHGIVMTIAGSL